MTKLLPVHNKIEIEKIFKIAPFKKEIRKTTPHKHHNYFELIYISKGSGHHVIDLNRYEINPPVIFCIRKEQVHYWDLTTEGKGYVIIIKKPFLDQSVDPGIKSLFNNISTRNCYYLNATDFIESVFSLLLQVTMEESQNQFLIQEGLLKSLLGKLISTGTPASGQNNLRSGLYASFTELIAANGNIKKKVKLYAEQLNVSPQNLNAACQKASGQSASAILSDHIINEAKRLLLYTDNTISEIAFELGFTDPSHFVKYFKKLAGATPQNFRFAHS